ncbi:MAG: ATP-binding protein, partial [Pseudomonadota bacterium]
NSAAQSQAQLMTALDSINEIFVLFGSDDAMLLCNRVSLGLHPQASEIFVPGRSRSEIKQELINRGVLAPHVRLEDFEEGNGSFGSQMVMLELADGRHISIAEKTTPDGGTVMVAANISDTVEREIALRRAKEVAELASRTKSDFLANVSHELRTPLNAIIGFSEIMRDELLGPVGTPQYKDYMTSILDSGRHLLSLINDILDISKAEVGKLTLVEDIFDLNDTFKSVKTLVQERAWRAEVKLVVEIETEDTRVRADERKIKQILLNLLSNAIKFTLAGGSVSMILRRLDNGFLEIEVKDTGIGIAEEDIEVALTPFGQVDSRLNRKYDGTGLGLPLSVALVELHHGALAVESEPGVGTTITVSLPSGRVLDSKSLSKIS